MEQPPQFADVNAALEHILEKLTVKKQVVRLALMLKKGVSVEYIAKAMLFEGFTRGKWTPDTALLMLRIVMAMIIAVASNAGVKNPTILNPDRSQEQFLDQFIDDDMEGEMEDENGGMEEASEQLPQFQGILGAL